MIIIVISVQPEVCGSRISGCHSLRRPYSPEMETTPCFYLDTLYGNQEAVAIETERERKKERDTLDEWESTGHIACVMC